MQRCPTCNRPLTRSNGQNRFLWGVIYRAIAEETGHSSEEVHEYCKNQFLPKMFVVINNVEIESRKSTTQLTTDEFSQFLDRAIGLAGELGITIPDRHGDTLI